MIQIGLTDGFDGPYMSFLQSMVSSMFVCIRGVSWARMLVQRLVQVNGTSLCVVAGSVGTTVPFGLS